MKIHVDPAMPADLTFEPATVTNVEIVDRNTARVKLDLGRGNRTAVFDVEWDPIMRDLPGTQVRVSLWVVS